MASAAPASAQDPSTYTRLHITPFDSSLQSLVIPASILPRARNFSYHTIETFPDKRFGFVDLPVMDADKIKKKLNGAVLKGTKIRIETARPETIPEPTAAADADAAKEAKKEKKKSKKRKLEPDVIEGVQLEGRKVKRGWTTTEQEMIDEKRKKVRKDKKEETSKDEKKDKKDKKKKKVAVKSKYTDEPECLFKTKLPDTRPAQEATEEDDSTHKKKRKRKSDREVIVHEFEKTIKYPTFLKSTSAGPSAEASTFKDGVGWMDNTGKVLESVKSKRRAEGIPAPDVPKSKKEKAPPAPKDEEDDDDETSSSGSSSSDDDDDDDTSSSDSELEVSRKQRTETPVTPKPLKVNTSALSNPSAATKAESSRPKSAGSMTSLSIKIPSASSEVKQIHPLEALYKKQPGDDGAATQGESGGAKPFSFFGNEDDIEEDGGELSDLAGQAPMTPFTKQEFEYRNIRSAAPTPDTAHPSRSFNFWTAEGGPAGGGEEGDDDDDDDDEEEEEDEPEGGEDVEMAGGDAGQAPVSDFQKQFWETRGNLNRAWRKRRKLAAKEKRYRDNRARAERAI